MLCPHCSQHHDPSISTCPTTGYALKCSKCGNRIEEKNATSCSHCGEFLPPVTNPQETGTVTDDGLKCPSCGDLITRADDICPNCGQYLLGVVVQEKKGPIQDAVAPEKKESPSKPEQIKVRKVPSAPKKVEKESPAPKTRTASGTSKAHPSTVKAQDKKADQVKVTAPLHPVIVPKPKIPTEHKGKTPAAPRSQPQKKSRGGIAFGCVILLFAFFSFSLYGIFQLWKTLNPSPTSTANQSITLKASSTFVNTLSATKTILTVTPSVTAVPTKTLIPTIPPPTSTPTIPVYPEISSGNVDLLTPVLKLDSPKGAGSVAFSPNNRLLAAAGYDGFVRIWNPYSGVLVSQLGENAEDLYTVAFDTIGSKVAAGGADHDIYMWDVQTGQLVRKFAGHLVQVNQIVFHPYKDIMASSSSNVILWDMDTGKIITSFPKDAIDFAFTMDGDALVVPDSYTRTIIVERPPSSRKALQPFIRILDIETQKTLFTYNFSASEEPGVVTCLAVSPDGEQIAAGGPDDMVWLGNINSKYLDALSGYGFSGEITSIAFSPDSQILAAGTSGSQVVLWNAETRQLLRILEGHSQPVRDVTFSPDGTALASASDDDTVIIWRIK